MAETPRYVRATNRTPSGTGSFGNAPSLYDQSPTEFDQEARNTLNGLGPSKTKLTAEQVKQAFEDAQREDQRIITNKASADEFLLLNSEFLDTPKNGKLMNETLRTLFGVGSYNVAQFEQAYAVLHPTGVLDLDQSEIVKQQQKAVDAQRKAAIKSRADAAARAFNQNANYDNLSLEELRSRANEELSIAGEQEGANGF